MQLGGDNINIIYGYWLNTDIFEQSPMALCAPVHGCQRVINIRDNKITFFSGFGGVGPVKALCK